MRGFKYGTTTTDTWTVSESGTFNSGEFKMDLSNLVASTTYYYRAFATNSYDTSYGVYIQVITEKDKRGTPIIFNRNVILNKGIILK